MSLQMHRKRFVPTAEQVPPTHSDPSGQRLPQLPQWCSFFSRFTHLPLQQVWFERHRLEQLPQWRSLVLRFTHLSPQRVCPSEHRSSSLAQATPGTEAKAAPRRAPPIHLIALPLERVPVARPLASSSKDWLVVCWLTCCPHSPKGGTRGLAPPSCTTKISMNGYKTWRNFREPDTGELRRRPLPQASVSRTRNDERSRDA